METTTPAKITGIKIIRSNTLAGGTTLNEIKIVIETLEIQKVVLSTSSLRLFT